MVFLLLHRIGAFPLCGARERQNDLTASCVDLQAKPPLGSDSGVNLSMPLHLSVPVSFLK